MAESPFLTAPEARASLEEAARRAAQVRHHDMRLSAMLFLVLAVYGAAGVVVSLSPRQGRWLPLVMLAVVVAAVAAAVVIGLRIRAYSRVGIRLFFGSIIAFNLWLALVSGASIATRFWASGQPSYHFGISVAIEIIPLIVGALILARRA
ncbi:MAG TPA: hypothetical protein VHO95_06875 [Candidatus Dormibacteraeota bacterium]|nr:hypothetical protein [Candidatus Dormibacteraeota bacterium]